MRNIDQVLHHHIDVLGPTSRQRLHNLRIPGVANFLTWQYPHPRRVGNGELAGLRRDLLLHTIHEVHHRHNILGPTSTERLHTLRIP